MISKFVVENLTTQQKATFGQQPSCDYLYKEDGIDWGYVQVRHNTFSYPGQIGVSISSTTVLDRTIQVVGYVCYVLSKGEREGLTYNEQVAYGYEKIKIKKDYLSSLCNPLQYVRLSIGDYYIDGKPSKSITYGDDVKDNNQYFCKFLLSIYCADPMFKHKGEIKTLLSGSIPKFRFPLIFKQNSGIVMSIKREYKLIAIENTGDVPIGCIITFEAKGVLKNPRVENIQNGDTIVIDKTMSKGEKIVVNTYPSEKTIKGYIDNVEYNYLKYWNFQNDWMQFANGISLVGYSVSDGDEGSLDVSIEINPMKYNLEEM